MKKKKQLTASQCIEVIDYLDSLGFSLDNADRETLEALMKRSLKIQGENFLDKFINYQKNHNWYKSVRATANELMNKVYGHYYIDMLTYDRDLLTPEELLIPAGIEKAGEMSRRSGATNIQEENMPLEVSDNQNTSLSESNVENSENNVEEMQEDNQTNNLDEKDIK